MTKNSAGTLKLPALTALVVGSMIGGGIFSLPQNIAHSAGAGATLIGWSISAAGMLMLAFVFQQLATRKSKLDGGVYAYARAGFGDFFGFNAAWGYWIAAWLGNVSFMVVLFSALSYFVPAFGEGNTPLAIGCASVLLWCFHFLILRGVSGAALINQIATAAKLVPLLLFVVMLLFAFNVDTFAHDFWKHPTAGGVMEQVRGMMLVTVFVFMGIEGASVYSSRALHRADVGRATILGFLITLVMLMAVSVLSLGVMSVPELKQLKNPSTALVLSHVVGNWGAVLINIGLVVSIGGALLAWTLLAAEIPYLAARDGAMPAWLGRENANRSPSASLWLSNACVQLFLLVVLMAKSSYLTVVSLTTSMILVPYWLSAAYAVKLALTGESYAASERLRGKEGVIAILAALYGLWLLYAAGPRYLLLSALLYVLGLPFWIKTRREQGKPLFAAGDALLALLQLAGAAVSLWGLWSGELSL